MSKLEFKINKEKDMCRGCAGYQIPYRENIHWDIKWNPNDNLFFIFFYVREEKGIRVYAEPILNDMLRQMLGDKERVNEFVENSMDKLSKLNDMDFKNRGN